MHRRRAEPLDGRSPAAEGRGYVGERRMGDAVKRSGRVVRSEDGGFVPCHEARPGYEYDIGWSLLNLAPPYVRRDILNFMAWPGPRPRSNPAACIAFTLQSRTHFHSVTHQPHHRPQPFAAPPPHLDTVYSTPDVNPAARYYYSHLFSLVIGLPSQPTASPIRRSVNSIVDAPPRRNIGGLHRLRDMY